MKRVLAFLIIAILMTGCNRKYSYPEFDQNTDTQDKEREKIVLWSYYETEEQQRGLDQLVFEFNLSQNKYEASWEYHGPVTAFNKQLAVAINENQLPDMVIIDNPDMRSYVELGLFEDITSEILKRSDLSEFYPTVLGSVAYDNKYYGMPFCGNNVGLFYNKDTFAEAGLEPPVNWEEFKVVASKLTDGKNYGFAMSAISGEQSAFQILPWILSAGEDMESLGQQATTKAYQLIKDLVEEGSLSKDCINWSQNDVARKFISGESAMMENGPWVLPEVIESKINYGIVRLPVDEKSVSVAGGENIGVIKNKNITGALAFIDFYYQDDIMLKISKISYSLPPKQRLASNLAKTNPEYNVFVEQMATCISRSSYEFWPEVTDQLSKGLFQVVTGELTPEEVSLNFTQKDFRK